MKIVDFGSYMNEWASVTYGALFSGGGRGLQKHQVWGYESNRRLYWGSWKVCLKICYKCFQIFLIGLIFIFNLGPSALWGPPLVLKGAMWLIDWVIDWREDNEIKIEAQKQRETFKLINKRTALTLKNK